MSVLDLVCDKESWECYVTKHQLEMVAEKLGVSEEDVLEGVIEKVRNSSWLPEIPSKMPAETMHNVVQKVMNPDRPIRGNFLESVKNTNNWTHKLLEDTMEDLKLDYSGDMVKDILLLLSAVSCDSVDCLPELRKIKRKRRGNEILPSTLEESSSSSEDEEIVHYKSHHLANMVQSPKRCVIQDNII